MELKKLDNRTFQDQKIQKCYDRLIKLNDILDQKDLSTDTIHKLNQELSIVRTSADKPVKEFKKVLQKKTYTIFKIVEKNHKLVPKNYYRNQWLAIGMAMFGMPFGMMFGFALDNLAFLGLGLPFGMMIGIAIGDSKDKEAAKKGLQLDLDYY